MELLQLKYFVSSAGTLNFSKTAQIFRVPQSAVSQSVKRLEKEIGTELFIRSANKIRLSRSGEIFFRYISKGLCEIDSGIKELRGSEDEVTGEVTILIRSNRNYVTDYIAGFKGLYPKVEFCIFHDYPGYDAGKFDLVVDDIVPENGEFEKFLLISEKVNIGFSPNHHFAGKSSVTCEELMGEKFVIMPEGTSFYRMFDNLCYTAGIRPEISICCDDPYYVRKYVAMNLGITIIPEISWKGLTDGVMTLPVSDMDIKRNTYVFERKNINSGSVPHLFRKYLTGEI